MDWIFDTIVKEEEKIRQTNLPLIFLFGEELVSYFFFTNYHVMLEFEKKILKTQKKIKKHKKII